MNNEGCGGKFLNTDITKPDQQKTTELSRTRNKDLRI